MGNPLGLCWNSIFRGLKLFSDVQLTLRRPLCCCSYMECPARSVEKDLVVLNVVLSTVWQHEIVGWCRTVEMVNW